MSQRTEKLRRQLEHIKAQMDFDECRIGYLESEIANTQHNLSKVEHDNKLRCRHTAHYVDELKEEVRAKRGGAFGAIAALLLLASIINLAAVWLNISAQGKEETFAPAAAVEAAGESGSLPGDDTPAAGCASEEALGAQYIGDFRVTHYCICEKCCGKDESHPAYGITRSGAAAVPYETVAVDPEVIPLGSEIIVDYGDGVEHR